jgi:hypothetical protein
LVAVSRIRQERTKKAPPKRGKLGLSEELAA